MLQDIYPQIYHNEMSFRTPKAGDIALIYTPQGIMCQQGAGDLLLPRIDQCTPETEWIYAFSIDETCYYLPLSDTDAPGFAPCGDYRSLARRVTAFACSVGHSLYRWYRGNRFCGACGHPMQPDDKERAMVCPQCAHRVYPKICPAVIVAVYHGDRLLLTRYAGRAFKRYALVAGFCEIGETVEDCVRREVMEETGLKVDRLTFYKSQPWVVTDTLLMGFFARLSGGEDVRLQEDELAEATWFDREEIPGDFSGDSLTGEMITLFRKGIDLP